MMIGVLDYKYCNSKSVFETLNVLTDDVCYVTDAKQIKNISKLVIPGVGSAKVSLDYLKKNGFTEEIVKFVERGQDILGICLGMQILFKNLSENGISEGLSFFESNVEPISEVSKIKTAKMLKFTITESDKKTAQSKVQEICDDLRIYNPMVSVVVIDVFEN